MILQVSKSYGEAVLLIFVKTAYSVGRNAQSTALPKILIDGEAYLCRTTDDGKTTSKEAILRCAHERNDAWGREVAFRANLAVSDLHAADARYHRDCLAKFFTNRQSAESLTDTYDSALDDLLIKMSSDFTRTWNSVELYNLYGELGGTLLSRRSLIKSVHEHFHPNLLILSSPGVASILVFRGKASDNLRIIDDAQDDCDSEE